MQGTADVIVVGLGAMGSATCLALARRGVEVLGLDRYEPPHPHGSSHGETRITRLAIGEGPEYAPLVRRSHELWRMLELETGTSVLTQQGGLIIGAPDSAFLRQTFECAVAYDVPHERLDAAQLGQRFPMFVAQEQIEAYYEPEAGFLRPETAVAAQLELARRLGAEVHLNECVEGWSADAHGVTVRAGGATYCARRLVLCAGAWIAELFSPARELLTVYRQTLHWWPINEGFERLREMPIFVWDFAAPDDDPMHLLGFYGFPALDGPHGGIKVAAERFDERATPDGRAHEPRPEEAREIHARYIARHLPWLGAEPLRSTTCLYTMAPKTRFLIDRHPEHDAVTIVSACSGHGFKHSPAIGEAVTQQLLDGASGIDLSPFALASYSRRQ